MFNTMYDIVSREELALAVKSKPRFELAREFVFWSIRDSREDLQIIAREFYARRGGCSMVTFFLVAWLTNTLHFFVEIQVGFRWHYFEDRPKTIFRQYAIGFLYLSLLPLAMGMLGFFSGRSIKGLVVTAIIIYGITLVIGLVKSIFDSIHFVQLTKS